MTRDSKHYPDNEPIPLSAWWLLNGAGRPPTWAQLERGAAARRRESFMSHSKPKGGKTKESIEQSDQKEQSSEDAGACAEQVAETKAEKKGRAGAPGTRPRGFGTFRRLMSRLRKRPAKRPASSHPPQQGDLALEVGQGPGEDTGPL